MSYSCCSCRWSSNPAAPAGGVVALSLLYISPAYIMFIQSPSYITSHTTVREVPVTWTVLIRWAEWSGFCSALVKWFLRMTEYRKERSGYCICCSYPFVSDVVVAWQFLGWWHMVGIVKSSYISSTLETCLMKSKSFAFSINVVECLFVLFLMILCWETFFPLLNFHHSTLRITPLLLFIWHAGRSVDSFYYLVPSIL